MAEYDGSLQGCDEWLNEMGADNDVMNDSI